METPRIMRLIIKGLLGSPLINTVTDAKTTAEGTPKGK